MNEESVSGGMRALLGISALFLWSFLTLQVTQPKASSTQLLGVTSAQVTAPAAPLPSLAGRWTGTETRDVNGLPRTFKLNFYIVQGDNGVLTGLARRVSSDGKSNDDFITEKLEGKVENDGGILLRESEWVSDFSMYSDNAWGYRLKFDRSANTFSGVALRDYQVSDPQAQPLSQIALSFEAAKPVPSLSGKWRGTQKLLEGKAWGSGTNGKTLLATLSFTQDGNTISGTARLAHDENEPNWSFDGMQVGSELWLKSSKEPHEFLFLNFDSAAGTLQGTYQEQSYGLKAAVSLSRSQ